MQINPDNVLEHRRAFHEESNQQSSPFRDCLAKCTTEIVTINPAKYAYGGMYKHMDIYVHKPKNVVRDVDRPAFIYFHGGAFVFNNAFHTAPIACHHALNFDCTVFGVDYGVAPEVKAPTGGLNAYAAVKYIVENA
jgi:acetyl esterase/lipase